VTFHLVAQRSFGLYQRAVTQSGGFSQWVAKPMAHCQDNYEYMMGLLGLDKDGGVESLVERSSEDIITNTQYWNPYPWPDTMVQCQWAPCIDGVELPSHPARLLAEKKIPEGVDVIFGSNRDEGTLFVSNNSYTKKQGHYSNADLPRGITASQFADFVLGSWGYYVGSAIVDNDLYPLECHEPDLEYDLCDQGTYNTHWWAASRATGDFMMTCTARRAARGWLNASLAAGAGAGADPPDGRKLPFIGNYYFAHTPIVSVNMHFDPAWGAFHGSEVPFVFHDDFELLGPAERGLSSRMVGFWTNFARTGDPNGDGPSPSPPPLGGRHQQRLWPSITSLNSSEAVRLAVGRWTPYTSDYNHVNISRITNLRARECDFWDEVNIRVIHPLPDGKGDAELQPPASTSSSASFSSPPSPPRLRIRLRLRPRLRLRLRLLFHHHHTIIAAAAAAAALGCPLGPRASLRRCAPGDAHATGPVRGRDGRGPDPVLRRPRLRRLPGRVPRHGRAGDLRRGDQRMVDARSRFAPRPSRWPRGRGRHGRRLRHRRRTASPPARPGPGAPAAFVSHDPGRRRKT